MPLPRALASFVLIALCLLAVAACNDQRSAIELGEDDLADVDVDTTETPDDDVSVPDTTDMRADGADVDPPDTTDTSDTFVPPTSAHALYLATAGVDVPMFVPVDAAGHGAPVELGPRRGAGYGLGEVELQQSWTSPDGTYHVVALRHLDRHTTSLFALDTASASDPVALGRLDEPTGEASFSDDGRRLAVVSGSRLFVTSALDDDAPTLTAIAAVDDATIVRPRWVAALERVAFEVEPSSTTGQITASIASAALDGSELDAPLQVTSPDGTQQRIQAVLPDGRLVFSRQGTLHTVLADATGPRTRLTPLDWTAGLEGVLDAGQALLVELRDSPGQPRQIVRVSTDGQQADSPLTLLADVDAFRGLLTDSGALVFRRRAPNMRASIEILDALDGTATPRILNMQLPLGPPAPWLAALTPDQSAVLVVSDARLLRIELDGDVTTEPTVLYDAGGANWGLEGLTAAGRRAVIWHDDAQVRRFETVAVDGSDAPQALDTGGWHPRASPTGVIWREPYAETGLYLRDREGQLLGPFGGWLPGEPTEAHLLDEPNPSVLFRLHDPATQTGRWHRVHPFQFEHIHTVLTEPGAWSGWLGSYRGHDLFEDSTSQLVVADGSGTTTVLPVSPGARWLWLPDAGQVVYAAGDEVHAVRIDTGEVHTVVAQRPNAQVEALGWSAADGGLVVAVFQSWQPFEAELVAAPLDGDASAPPRVVPLETSLLPVGLEGVPGGSRVLLSLASSDTAVPHPREVWSVDLISGEVTPLDPTGSEVVWSWHGGQALSGWPAGVGVDVAHLGSTTADGSWAALNDGQALHAARPDGSEIVELYRGQAWLQPLTTPLALRPDDGTVLIDAGLEIVAARLGQPDATRVLSPADIVFRESSAVLSGDGTAIHVYGGGGDAVGNGLWTLPLDGSGASQTTPTLPLTGDLEPMPLAVSPDGQLLMTCAAATDRRLCLWDPAGPASAVEVTPPDDAVERMVGFVGAL